MDDPLTNCLKLRKQKVVLNGQLSSWSNIGTDIPQGYILGPLLFLIYINENKQNKCLDELMENDFQP